MGLKTFHGGIHPFEGKELSKDKPITDLLPQGELVYPLSQHIGAPASPIVAVGDRVLKGQKIAEAGGYVSAAIFASVSGTVKKIEQRRQLTGAMANSIVIENDGLYEEVEYSAVENVAELSKEEIIARVKEGGVVGMGGAGFPTYVKLSPSDPSKIDYVIANCAECEPYLTSDYRTMLENGEELVEGMKIILRLFDGAKGLFGVENNKPDCIAHLQELVKDDPRLEVVPLMTKYPQGGERSIIYACTGRSINSSMLPADAGCIVDNVGTIVAVYNAVKNGKPLNTHVVTVTGDAIVDPRNFRVPCGTNFNELIAAAGGFKTEDGPEKIVAGGPMMGFAMYSTDVPVTKTSSAIIAFTKDEVKQYETTACINCGRCVEACPSRLVPSRLADYSEHGQLDVFEKWNGQECVECGSCSYVCPAKRHLALAIKSMRKTVLANRKKK